MTEHKLSRQSNMTGSECVKPGCNGEKTGEAD